MRGKAIIASLIIITVAVGYLIYRNSAARDEAESLASLWEQAKKVADTKADLSPSESENLAGVKNQSLPNGELLNKPLDSMQTKNGRHMITVETNFGEIQFQTYDADAPKTVRNFITLAQKGFYDNLIFHRVIKGFMIQGGDPKGNGTGGPGYAFEDELNPETESYKAGYKKGVVAMANAGPDTNGSQFFIMLEDYSLPHNYTIFGKVVKGQDAVDKIGQAKTGAGDRPIDPVVIKKVAVAEMK